ncbi:MAG: SIMPL domain-containing protein [Acidimicrobiales bacterium]|jgi:uncharacterized protein YggE
MVKKATITVQATGSASAPPDNARIRLFVFAEDPAPGDALTSCSLLAERVLAGLRDDGVAPSDLETISIDLNEQHRRDGEASVSTYRASSSLLATVRPPKDAGRIIAAAVDAAGTGVGINNVSFDIDDRAPLLSAARRDAVVQAFSAAHELAETAGLVLGPLVDLAEGNWPRQFGGDHFKRARPLSGAQIVQSAPPLELGELSVAVTVTAVFEVVSPATS